MSARPFCAAPCCIIVEPRVQVALARRDLLGSGVVDHLPGGIKLDRPAHEVGHGVLNAEDFGNVRPIQLFFSFGPRIGRDYFLLLLPGDSAEPSRPAVVVATLLDGGAGFLDLVTYVCLEACGHQIDCLFYAGGVGVRVSRKRSLKFAAASLAHGFVVLLETPEDGFVDTPQLPIPLGIHDTAVAGERKWAQGLLIPIERFAFDFLKACRFVAHEVVHRDRILTYSQVHEP